MRLPERDLLTRGDLRRCLGIGNSTIDKWVRSGCLRRRVLPGMVHGRFLRADVKKLLDASAASGNC